MTTTTTRTQLGALATRVARTLVVTFLAVPGLGLGLLGVACQGDDAEPTPITAAATSELDATSPDAAAGSAAPAPTIAAPPTIAETPSWAKPEAAPMVGPPTLEPAIAEPARGIASQAPVIAEPTRHEVDRDADLAVLESALSTGVSDRVPTGVASSFGTDTDRVWAWVKVRNRQAPTTITMIWRKGETVRSRVTLDVGTSGRWRTWSRRRVGTRDIGAWSVEILDADGTLLDTLSFEVTHSAHSEGGC